MAHALDVSRGMVSRWENDRHPPRKMVLLSYACLCRVPVRWLETGER